MNRLTRTVAFSALLLYPLAGIGQAQEAPAEATSPADAVSADSPVETPARAPALPAEAAVAPADVQEAAAEPAESSAETTSPADAVSADSPVETPAQAPAVPAEATVAPADAQETAAEPAESSAETATPADAVSADSPVETPAQAPAVPAEATVAPADAQETAAEPAESSAETTPPAAPRDFSIVRTHLVVVRDGIDEAARQAPGFGISEQGHILTDSNVLRRRDTYLVSVAGGQVFKASALKTDDETGIMLIRIAEEGHGLTALTFARTALAPAAPLYAVTFNPEETEPFAPAAGAVTQLPTGAEDAPLIIHNALFNVAAAGTPLLNRCWEAVGVNVLQRKGFPPKRVDPVERGSAESLTSVWLSAFLTAADLSLPVTESECLSPEEEIRLHLEQASQEKEAALQAQRVDAEARARAVAEQAQRKEAELSQEKDAIQQQLEQARREAEQALSAEREDAEAQRERFEQEQARLEEEAQQRLEQAQRDKEQAVSTQRQEAELARQTARQATQRGKQILMYSLALGLVLALVFVFVLRARRKRLQGVQQEKQQIAQALGQAQADLSDASEREQLRAGAPDVLIEGSTPQQERIALKIPGVSLVEGSGAVVGRSPAEAAFIIHHEQVSRRHFRLLLASGQVMIEDLGSTNGTSVNGIPLDPGARQPLSNGSRIQTGNLALTVRIGAWLE